MPIIVRIIATVALVAVAGFSVFGFLAAGEVPDWPAQLPWRIGYAILGLVCLAGIWLEWPRKRN